MQIYDFEFAEPLTRDEEGALFERVQWGNADAAKKLIEHNLRLVATIVIKYSQPFQYDEAFSAGVEALTELIHSKKFSPSQGCFSTYAYKFLMGAVLKVARVQDCVYFPPKHAPVWQDDTEAIGNWDIRRHMTVEAAESMNLLDKSTVDQPAFDFSVLDHDDLVEALKSLTPSEHRVIEAMYFGDKTNTANVAETLGLCRSVTHTNHCRALRKLRAVLEKREVEKYKGVTQLGKNSWEVRIERNGKFVFNKRFSTAAAAVKARENFLNQFNQKKG